MFIRTGVFANLLTISVKYLVKKPNFLAWQHRRQSFNAGGTLFKRPPHNWVHGGGQRRQAVGPLRGPHARGRAPVTTSCARRCRACMWLCTWLRRCRRPARTAPPRLLPFGAGTLKSAPTAWFTADYFSLQLLYNYATWKPRAQPPRSVKSA